MLIFLMNFVIMKLQKKIDVRNVVNEMKLLVYNLKALRNSVTFNNQVSFLIKIFGRLNYYFFFKKSNFVSHDSLFY